MAETRTRETIEKEIADIRQQVDAHHAAIHALTERNTALHDELASLTQGWAIVAECDPAGNLRDQPQLHELCGRAKTVGYSGGAALCLRTFIDVSSRVAPLQIFDVRPDDHRWWNREDVELGSSVIHTVLGPSGEPLTSFYVSFHRTCEEAEAATNGRAPQPPQGWAVVTEYDGTDGKLGNHSQIYALGTEQRVEGRNGAIMRLRLDYNTSIEGRGDEPLLEASDVRADGCLPRNPGYTAYGTAVLHTVLNADGMPLTSFYITFHRTREEAEDATRAPGSLPAAAEQPT